MAGVFLGHKVGSGPQRGSTAGSPDDTPPSLSVECLIVAGAGVSSVGSVIGGPSQRIIRIDPSANRQEIAGFAVWGYLAAGLSWAEKQ